MEKYITFKYIVHVAETIAEMGCMRVINWGNIAQHIV
jgi:hypothetical protein